MKKRFRLMIMIMVLSCFMSISSFAEVNGIWQSDNSSGTWFTYNDQTHPRSCFIEKDGKIYYLDENAYLEPNSTIFDNYKTDKSGVVIGYTSLNDFYSSSGWQQDEKGWWYQNPDGTYPVNVSISVNDKEYWLGADGYMLHDCYAPDYRYYGSDGAYIKTILASGKSAEEIMTGITLDDSLKPHIWEMVCDTVMEQSRYEGILIFPDWNDAEVSYSRSSDDGTVVVHGYCLAKNDLGNYMEVSISAIIAADYSTVEFCYTN